MAANSFADLLKGFSRGGREFLRRHAPFLDGGRAQPVASRLEGLVHALVAVKGEASGLAIASDLLDSYDEADAAGRTAFFRLLAEKYAPDADTLANACRAYLAAPADATLKGVARAADSPRKELFRRLNRAPGATSRIVAMRRDLLAALRADPALAPVDDDLAQLLQSWFNRGFLEMRRLTWSSPADILERLIRYEAVHSIRDWSDLRGRLDPPDRRCFAFFHPAMPDEPLIFVEVALTEEMASSVQAILDPDRVPVDPAKARAAVFYSISNCQAGLAGISFGNFLIKQVVAELARDLAGIEQFVTLSPVPGFLGWLRGQAGVPGTPAPAEIERLAMPGWWEDADFAARIEPVLLARALAYFTEAKAPNGRPVDPVARFHLGNGARLERINWLGDRSPNGLRQSAGLMVNYLYALDQVEENHEAFADHGTVATGKPLKQLAKKIEAAEAEKASAKKAKGAKAAA